MATLQKIRNHGVLLAIIIGLALLAFIIGDFINSGSSIFQQSQQQVINVEGETVDIADYQAAIDQMQKIYEIEFGRSNFNEQELAQIRNSVWESLVNEKVLNLEAEKIGLTISQEELKDRLIGNNIHPLISQRRAFVDPQTGKFSRTQLVNFYNNLFGEDATNSAELQDAKNYWLFWEKEVRNAILQEKFVALFGKSVGVNSVQAKYNYDAHNASADVNYIVQPYYTVADSTVEVSDNDIKKRYNDKKELFKQEPNRAIKYVAFDVEPLAEDFEEAQKWIDGIQDEFKTTDDIASLVNQESDRSYTGENYSKATVPAKLKDFAFSNSTGAIYGPVFENNTHTMAKIVKSGILESDSVKLRHIALAPTDENKADSIMKALRSGSDFAQVAKTTSLVPQTAANGGEIGWVPRQGLDKAVVAEAFSKGKNEIFKVNNGQSIQIFQILDKSPARAKVKLAILERKVTPSNSSYSKIYNDAKQFAVNGNNPEKFDQVANEKGYIVRRAANLEENSQNVNMIPQSRQVVKWAWDNDKGSVSDVFDCDRQSFIVACVEQINEDEYRSLKDVSVQIKAELLRDKKAEKMIAQIAEQQKSNTTVEGLASAMGAEVKTASGVNFSSFQFGEAGNEPAVIGQSVVLPANKLSKGIQGNAGVYVIQVLNKTKDATPYSQNLEQNQLNSKLSGVVYQVIRGLRDKYEIEDNRSRFY